MPCGIDVEEEECEEEEEVPIDVEMEEEAESAEGEEGRSEWGEKPNWLSSKAGRERMKLVMQEMEWHEGGRGKPASKVCWEEADDAESVKCGLRRAYLAERGVWGEMSTELSKVWYRVELQRLRFQGQKRWYCVVRTWDRVHRLLVLAVPPKQFDSDEERREHAQRQATYQDDIFGNYAPGMRVRWDKFLPYLTEDELVWVNQVRRGGLPLQLHKKPATYFKQKNYGSYESYEEKGEDELNRMGSKPNGWRVAT